MGDHQVRGQNDLAASQGDSRTWGFPLNPVLSLACPAPYPNPQSSNRIKEPDAPHTPSFSTSATGQ